MKTKEELMNALHELNVPVPVGASLLQLRNLLNRVVGKETDENDDMESFSVARTNLDEIEDDAQSCKSGANWVAEVQQVRELPVANQVEQTEESKVNEKIEILEKESKLLRLQIQVEQEKKQLNQLQKGKNNMVMKGKDSRVDVLTIQHMCGKFEGNERQDVTVWLNSVEQMCDLLYYDSAERIIAMMCLLEGDARWLFNRKKIQSYAEAKEELLKEFGGKASAGIIRQRLQRRKIKYDETPKSYVRQMQQIAEQGLIPEVELIDFIIDGLSFRSDIKSALYTATNIDELCEKLDRVEGRVMRVMQPNLIRKVVQNTNIRCYNCFKYGHYQGVCDKPKRPANSCFICAEVGHFRDNCPKRRVEKVAFVEADEDRSGGNIRPNNNVSISFCDTDGRIIKRNIHALFDTGSPASFIKRSCVWCQRLIRRSSRKQVYKGFGKEKVDVTEEIDITLYFRGEQWKHTFWIVSDRQAVVPLLVGTDLLKKMGIGLGKRNNTLKYTIFELKKLNNVLFKRECNIPINLEICKNKENCKMINNQSDVNKECVGNVGCTKQNEVVQNSKSFVENELVTKSQIFGETVDSRIGMEVETEDRMLNINTELGKNDQKIIEQMIVKHCERIKGKNEITKFNDLAMRIELSDSKPVHCYPRRLSHSQKCEVQKMIKELLEQGIIRSSHSPYASPIVLVNKKNGQLRMCVDYRSLNKITVKDNFPLPLIDDCLSYLGGKMFFSSLDLKNGFHQVPMHEDSIQKTAFVTWMGQYEYKYMPFGLKNAPPVFQRFISAVLRPLINSGKIVVYLDDIIVATNTIQKHVMILQETLQLLSEAGLRLNLKKCKFGYQELVYLGYRVNQFGIRLNEDHVRAVREYAKPTDVKGVKKTLGLFSYFRRFVPNFARIASPLHALVRKDAVFQWTEECEEAFNTLKVKITETPVLSIFDPKKETELHTDASSKGFGAVLLQKQEDKKFHPVAFYSKTTTEAESKYHSFELETLAIVKSLERFRMFLDGISFVIVTDCNSLVMTLEKKLINPRIARWTLGFADFDFTIRHRKGEQMQHVDALSRGPVVGVVEETEVDNNIQFVQSQDPTVEKLKQRLESEVVEGYVLEDGLVFRVGKDGLQLYVPKAMENSVMQMAHENYGHQGIDKCANQILKHYWFPDMRKKLGKFIQNCLKCIYYTVPSRSNQRNLYNIEKIPVPFDTIHIDHFGPLEAINSKHKHILAVVDSFTKFVKLYAVNTGAKETICSLKKYIASYSRPRRIVSDRGACFTSKEFKMFCKDNNIIHVLNAVASPQSNGQVERVNRVLRAMLAKVTEPWNHSDWSAKLVDVEFAINNTVHTATRETPSKLLFGVEQRGRIINELTEYLDSMYSRDYTNITDRRKNAEEAIKKAQLNNQRNFEKTHTEAKRFTVGDLVVIKNVDTTVGKNKKLIPKYKGPFLVSKQIGHDRYMVTDVENCQLTQMPYQGVIDSSRMKKWLDVSKEESPEVTEGNTEVNNDEYVDYEFLDENNEIVNDEETNNDDYVNYEFLNEVCNDEYEDCEFLEEADREYA